MIFFYKYFAHDAQCRTNLYFVSFSLCQCVAATVISVLPKVQEAQSGTGMWRHKIVLIDSGKSNGKVRFGSFRQEYSDSHLAVVHFDRTDRNLPPPFKKPVHFSVHCPTSLHFCRALTIGKGITNGGSFFLVAAYCWETWHDKIQGRELNNRVCDRLLRLVWAQTQMAFNVLLKTIVHIFQVYSRPLWW